MKKFFCFIFLFLTSFLVAEEIKIYRESAIMDMYISGINGSLFGAAGITCLGAAMLIEERNSVTKTLGYIGTGGVFSALFFYLSIKFFQDIKRHKKWNSLMDEPVLILDDEGFAVQIITEDCQAKYVRYSWKDVVSYSTVTKENGSYKKWQYVVRNSEGKEETVTISESELVIPQELKAKIEVMLLTPVFLNPQKS